MPVAVNHEIETKTSSGGVVALLRASSRPSARDVLRPLAPGIGITAGVAAVATVIGGRLPLVGAPVIAILCGIAISIVNRPAGRFRAGIAFSSKKVLQASIVLLGSSLSLGQVLSTGARSLPVLLGTLLAGLAMAWLAGRLLGLRGDVTTLVGVGTAICGASAIAAADAVIDADEADVSYAIATIFAFNIVAVLTYPALGHALGLSQHTFGLWTGTAINDLSSVVAASTVYGHAAATYGVIVKLTRVLAIIPICLGLAAVRGRRRGRARGQNETSARRVELRRIVPLFIVAFLGAVVANTVGLVPASWHHPVSDVSTWMITAAMAAIGLSTQVGRIRQAGYRPMALGAILWLTVGLASLGLQGLTGML
jgi:uncharacterized integral membrane protein (TIGR00698 family)